MDIKTKYRSIFNHLPEWEVISPGRVNILGEHVDYNDGLVLPMAIDLSVKLYASPIADRVVRLIALDLNEQESFELEHLEQKRSLNREMLTNWARYPAGVAWSLQNRGFEVRGIEAVYTSNIPIGSGLSSSAAVEVAFAVLWQAIGGWNTDRLTLAQICQQAENQYVGVSCGLMDQFASACGQKDHVLFLDVRSLKWDTIMLPSNIVVGIIDSGIPRNLVSSQYNERRASCQSAVKLLKEYIPDIKSLRDISPIEFAAYSEYLPEIERKRAEHVVKEIARVQSAINAIQRKDMQALGALLYSGHKSLRDLYEVSLPALDKLVELARQFPGCLGARLTGAGFGGCTVNLLEKTGSDEFIRQIVNEYHLLTGNQARGYICQASQGAIARRL